MSLDDDDILQILKFMNESEFEELNLKTGDLHLIVSKRKGGGAASQSCSIPEAQTSSEKPSITPTSTVASSA